MPQPIAIETIRLGRGIPYAEALALQRARRGAVETGEASEALFLLEHAPVITLGRNAHTSNLLLAPELLAQRGIVVAETDRGGDVTYHGPGQLVAYPIVHIERRGLSITGYLRILEQAVIDTLVEFGIEGGRVEGYTGVWVNGAKVAAIGVGVYRGVTFHGTAINVAPDMNHWQLIVPCGIADKPVTSLKQLLGTPPLVDEVGEVFAGVFAKTVGAAHRGRPESPAVAGRGQGPGPTSR